MKKSLFFQHSSVCNMKNKIVRINFFVGVEVVIPFSFCCYLFWLNKLQTYTQRTAGKKEMHTKNPFVPPGIDQPPENKGFKKKKNRTPSGTQSVGPAKNPVTPCTKKRPEIV